MKSVTQERREEIVDELEEIQSELGDLVHRLSRICDELDDGHARNYLIAGLEIVVEQGSWVSRDFTLPEWIAEIKEPEDDWNEEDELDHDTMFDILQNGVK